MVCQIGKSEPTPLPFWWHLRGSHKTLQVFFGNLVYEVMVFLEIRSRIYKVTSAVIELIDAIASNAMRICIDYIRLKVIVNKPLARFDIHVEGLPSCSKTTIAVITLAPKAVRTFLAIVRDSCKSDWSLIVVNEQFSVVTFESRPRTECVNSFETATERI